MTDNQDFTAAEDPFDLFRTWLADAEKSEPCDPEAMALATADSSGLPNVRMILLKGADERGFVFYTNCESAKGGELAANAKAALLFFWKSLGRQIRVRGLIEPVTDAEADAYFATRHPQSRIGAWASKQSRPLESRAVLEKAVARYTAEFRRARDRAAGLLARLSGPPGGNRVLAERRLPSSRPDRVPPHGARCALDQNAPQSVSYAVLFPGIHG